MNTAIQGLKPTALWKHFYQISQVPRDSGDEGKIRDFICQFAEERNIEFLVDGVGNVILKKPASPGYEDHPGVILQGHMDMVCEKVMDSTHDFSKDPLKLINKDGWIEAEGTTLGADNGIALAMAMTVMEDDSLIHGPMEALFTVDEEVGFTGAYGVEPEMLNGRILINLDSEDERSLVIGCAGGVITKGTLSVEYEPAPEGWSPMSLYVSGLQSGHSGGDIQKGLGNALQIAAAVLIELSRLGVKMSAFQGGTKDNVIPRECYGGLLIPPGKETAAGNVVEQFQENFRRELRDIEPELSIKLTKAQQANQVLSDKSFQKSIDLLLSIPHGVVGMSRRIPGLVETSTNMASAHLSEDKFHLVSNQRSSSDFLKDNIGEKTIACIRVAGGEAIQEFSYAGWTPNMESLLLAKVREIYKRVMGQDAEIEAIHGGLECGVLGEKLHGLDMISLGPNVERVHTPDERLNIESMKKVWYLLLEILTDL